MRNYVLLTGATGLLGQYLVRDLLRDGHRVAVLIRATKKQTAVERLEQIMQMWEQSAGTSLPRPVCLTGDITQDNLGMSADEFSWVKDNCSTMMHCAASLQFTAHKGEPWRTNVEGTKNVLALCEACDISEMHYISTAYVCGHRHDLVMEDELDVKQEFRNIYEESKFTAEKSVRECSAFKSLTVYRPVVITGDSVTGYTSTYHGTYLYMKLASVLTKNAEANEEGKFHIPVRWGLTGDERRNVTPVDWNSEIICKLFNNPEAVGKTFHLGPSDPITMRDAIEFASDFYGLTGIEFRGCGPQPDVPMNEMERWLWSNVSIYGSYDFMDPQFDMTNLLKYAPTPVCPKLDHELTTRLMTYAEEDRWGKRKKPELTPTEFSIEQHLQQIVGVAAGSDSPNLVGLDVLGPGGGQWTAKLVGDQLVEFVPGLPKDASAGVLQISAEQLAGLQGLSEKAADQIAAHFEGEDISSTAKQVARAFFPQTIENAS